MTSEIQIKANVENAQKSTGPKDCSRTKFNAIKYGLTSDCHFSKEDDQSINEIYEDLSTIFIPDNILKKYLVGRMAVYIWRIQKATNLEKTHFKNMLISAKNAKARNKEFNKLYPEPLFSDSNQTEEELISSETVDTSIELIMRYEVTNENRLIKVMKILQNIDKT